MLQAPIAGYVSKCVCLGRHVLSALDCLPVTLSLA